MVIHGRTESTNLYAAPPEVYDGSCLPQGSRGTNIAGSPGKRRIKVIILTDNLILICHGKLNSNIRQSRGAGFDGNHSLLP